jgi:hypothetical protein
VDLAKLLTNVAAGANPDVAAAAQQLLSTFSNVAGQEDKQDVQAGQQQQQSAQLYAGAMEGGDVKQGVKMYMRPAAKPTASVGSAAAGSSGSWQQRPSGKRQVKPNKAVLEGYDVEGYNRASHASPAEAAAGDDIDTEDLDSSHLQHSHQLQQQWNSAAVGGSYDSPGVAPANPGAATKSRGRSKGRKRTKNSYGWQLISRLQEDEEGGEVLEASGAAGTQPGVSGDGDGAAEQGAVQGKPDPANQQQQQQQQQRWQWQQAGEAEQAPAQQEGRDSHGKTGSPGSGAGGVGGNIAGSDSEDEAQAAASLQQMMMTAAAAAQGMDEVVAAAYGLVAQGPSWPAADAAAFSEGAATLQDREERQQRSGTAVGSSGVTAALSGYPSSWWGGSSAPPLPNATQGFTDTVPLVS